MDEPAVMAVPEAGINRIRLEFKAGYIREGRKQPIAVLIESDWNLKSLACPSLFGCIPCINRIRLEFKVTQAVKTVKRAISVLIESDWNLKLVATDMGAICKIVLIESDWNLKYLQVTVF